MINIRTAIEQRIQSEVPAFIEVAGAVDLDSIMQEDILTPGCYVYQEKSTASDNRMLNATVQQITLRIAVLTIVRNVFNSRGVGVADASSTLQNSILTALLGWQPDPDVDPIEYVDGELVSYKNGFFIWKDNYKAFQQIRSI